MTAKGSTARWVWLGALWTLAACSGSGGGSSLADLGIDDGASKGMSKSVQVTGDDDVRIALDTGALVDIPAGAVTKSVKVSVERPEDGKALKLVDRFKTSQDRIVSAPYVLTPHGTVFKEDVTVTLPLSKMGAREVSVAWLEDENDTEWKVLGVAKTNGKKAAITLKHFSVLVVVEDTSDLKPVEDGDDGEPEDAGLARDASVAADGGGVDAGADAAEPDAGGIDAGSTPDAAAPRDAGDDNSKDARVTAPDGSAPADASTSGDAAVPPDAEAGTDAAVTALYAKLQACGLVAAAGGFSEWGYEEQDDPWLDPQRFCFHRCVATSTCGDAEAYYCGLDVQTSAQYQACVAACPAPAMVCPGDPQQTLVARCDSLNQCPGGEDEVGCDPALFFQCGGGEYYPKYVQCNGISECANGQDEIGCHQCDSGRVLRPDYVCNGFVECVDQTDEPASCAIIACGPAI